MLISTDVTVENLLTEGDFSNGGAAWTFAGSGSYNASGYATIDCTAPSHVRQNGLTLVSGHQYFLGLTAKSTSGGKLLVRLYNGAAIVSNNGIVAPDTAWEFIGQILTATDNGDTLHFDRQPAVGSVDFDLICLIDLTADFDRPPSESSMCAWLGDQSDSWFDTTARYPYPYIRGRIDPISAKIHQEINGEYSCDIAISLDDDLAEYFVRDAIVYLDDANDTEQMFRIEKPERTLTTLYASGWHISQDLAQDVIVNKTYTNAVGSAVWTDLLTAGLFESRFSGSADTSVTGTMSIRGKSILESLIGSDGFISVWGGEVERNNFMINMKTGIGEDRNYHIVYQKNLTGLTVTDDNSTVVNRIVPSYLNADDEQTYLPEGYIDSASIYTAIPHARAIHYSDIRVGAEVDGDIPYPTNSDAEDECRARVAALYAAGVDTPLLTVDINFVQLRNTVEYSDYTALETVRIGDTIGAEYEEYSWTSEVVAYDWDAVLQRYDSIILGNTRPSLSDLNQSIIDEALRRSNAALTARTVELAGAISAAQTSADGKNTIYYSSTEPSGGTYIDGDTWFDTDDDNRIYEYDDGSWHAVQFGDNAIADLAITNAKIANGTIESAKIANIDAGKITTGELDAAIVNVTNINADNINTGTVSAEHIEVTSDTTFADGYNPAEIEVGARNLAIGTEFGEWVAYGSYTDVSHSDETVTNSVNNGDVATSLTSDNSGTRVGIETDGTWSFNNSYDATEQTFDLTAGDKIYMRTELDSASVGRIRAQSLFHSGGSVINGTNVTNSLVLSDILSVATSGLHNMKVWESTSGLMVRENQMLVNLTDAFGAGNEPTIADFEAWLSEQPDSWFDATAKVHGISGSRTNIAKATGNTATTHAMGIQQATTFRKLNLTEGQEYTLSFKVRGNVSAINYAYIMNSGYSNQNLSANETIASETDWTNVSLTFTADSNTGSSTASYIMISYNGAFTTSSWFEVCEVKLERGNKATDWCPASTEISTVNNETNVRYRIDAEKAGYYNATTNEFIGGVAVVGDKVASIAQMLTNSENPDFYVEIGDIDIDGVDWKGLAGYLTADTTTPVYTIVGGVVPSGWAAGNYGFFRSKNGYSSVSVKDYNSSGTVTLYGANSDGEYGEFICGDYGIMLNVEHDTKDVYFEASPLGTWHGINHLESWQIPIELWGKAKNVSTSAWTSVSFPYPYFPTGSVVHLLLSVETGTAGEISAKFRNLSTTGFEVTIGGSGYSGITVHWRAFASQ